MQHAVYSVGLLSAISKYGTRCKKVNVACPFNSYGYRCATGMGVLQVWARQDDEHGSSRAKRSYLHTEQALGELGYRYGCATGVLWAYCLVVKEAGNSNLIIALRLPSSVGLHLLQKSSMLCLQLVQFLLSDIERRLTQKQLSNSSYSVHGHTTVN